jgi:hypothetical protein
MGVGGGWQQALRPRSLRFAFWRFVFELRI